MLIAIAPFPVDVIPSWLDVLAVWATVAAALVAMLTGFLIWLQIRQTQRSVNATEQTLALAREEQEQNRKLIVNAQKSRIDAELPKLLVWVYTQSRSVTNLGLPDTFDFVTGKRPRNMQADDVWQLPRDGAVRLTIGIALAVSNDGPRRAHLTLTVPDDSIRLRGPRELIIPVGEQSIVHLQRTLTVAQWAQLTSNGGPTSELFTVTYTHQGTEGAVERWIVRQDGSPLVPAEAGADSWTIGPRDSETSRLTSLFAAVDMPSREYFSSMADRTLLV